MKTLYWTACAAGVLAALSCSQAANATSCGTGCSFTDDTTTLPTAFVSQPTPLLTNPPVNFIQNTTTSTSGVQLSPYFGTADNGDTYSVLNSGGGANPASATYSLVGGTTVVSFLWGSPDSYNSVELFSSPNGSGTPIGMLDGDLLTPKSPGSGFDYVTITDLSGIGSIELLDAGTAAFEFADITNVSTTLSGTPIPGALPLVAGGLGLIGLLRRRKQQAASVPA